jgi:hypothetical protein
MTGLRTIEEHTAQWRGLSLLILWKPQFLNTTTETGRRKIIITQLVLRIFDSALYFS